MHDVGFLVAELSGNYLRHVLHHLESCSTEVLDLVRRSILQAVTSLNDTLPIVKDTMVEGIAERSFEVSILDVNVDAHFACFFFFSSGSLVLMIYVL